MSNISTRMPSFEKKLEAWLIMVQAMGSKRMDLVVETSVPVIEHGSYLLRLLARGEPLDEMLRHQARAQFEDVTRSLITKRVLYDGRPICDETNNPPAVLDQKGLQLDLFLRPSCTPVTLLLPLSLMTQATADAMYDDWASTPPEKRGNEYKDRTRVQIMRG